MEVAANLLIFLPQMFLVLCLQKYPPIMIINNSKRLRSENITKEIEKSVERIKIMANAFHRARSPQPVTLTHLAPFFNFAFGVHLSPIFWGHGIRT